MPTNQEWLNQLATESPEKLKAWFDAEHNDTLTAKNDVSGDTAHPNDGNTHLKAHSKTEPMLSEQSWSLSEVLDSREKLEADANSLVDIFTDSYSDHSELFGEIIELLDRQAAITQHEITERWAEHLHPIERECGDLRRKVAELTAELEKATNNLNSANEDFENARAELTAERDNWKANCEDWEKHARAAENACYETMLEREDYRSKFGKCLDYADAIHALMDEGIA